MESVDQLHPLKDESLSGHAVERAESSDVKCGQAIMTACPRFSSNGAAPNDRVDAHGVIGVAVGSTRHNDVGACPGFAARPTNVSGNVEVNSFSRAAGSKR